MRLSLFLFLHVIVFIVLLIVHPHVRAEDDGWAIEEHSKDFIYLSKNGEVIHGDKLIFAMQYTNCDKLDHMFSFLTTKAPNDIHQFEQKRLPILLNGHEFTAKVILVLPVLNNKAFWVMFKLGDYETQKYAKLLSEFLEEENEKYEIRLADGFNFEAEKYFDITQNSWILDNFSEKFAETYKRCKEKTILKDS